MVIDNPKKISEGELTDMYVCEVYLPETEKKIYPIYGSSPIEALCFASDFAKGFLQGLINRNCELPPPKRGGGF